MSLIRVEFEIFGHVQGVYFRKYTKQKCDELKLRGWCMNTTNKTVKGVIEGEVERVQAMKHWLQFEGSPQSRIDSAVFSSETPIDKFSFSNFEIRR